MTYFRCLLFVLACTMVFPDVARPQTGRSFMFSVPPNFRNADTPTSGREPAVVLTLGADRATKVRIRVGGIAKDTVVLVPELNVVRVSLPMSVSNWTDSLTANATIRVEADNPVSVACLSQRFQTSESFIVLPVEALGRTYMLTAYTRLSADLLATATITAVEDGTVVTVTSPCPSSLGPAHAPTTVHMRAGQSIRVTAKWAYGDPSDLTGTVINANKVVSVVSAHRCAYVPAQTEACNYLVEQMVPTTQWGVRFVVPDIPGRRRHTVRVLALEDGTTATIADTTARLGRGEHVDVQLATAAMVVADRPVSVMAYSHGFHDGDSVGDPMMVSIPPVREWATDLIAMKPGLMCDRHDLVLMGAPAALAGATVNGRRLDTTRIHRVADGYATTTIDADLDYLVVQASEPIGAIVLGFGTAASRSSFDAYGHTAVRRTVPSVR